MTTPVTTTPLANLVEPLKREVAVPGAFDTIFPDTGDDDLIGALADGFAECRLDGFFGGNVVDLDTNMISPAISSGAAALIVIYSGIRIIRSQLRNMNSHVKYEAAGAIYEVDTAASVLTQELRDFAERKRELLTLFLRQQRAGQSVFVTDGYLTRSRGYFPVTYWGEFGTFYAEEVTGLAFIGGF